MRLPTPAEVAAFARESRAAAGLPPTVTDPDALRRVAALLDGTTSTDDERPA